MPPSDSRQRLFACCNERINIKFRISRELFGGLIVDKGDPNLNAAGVGI